MMVAFKTNVASAGTANTHDIAGAAANTGQLSATNLSVSNIHATGTLEITFSENGTDYTSVEHDVGPESTVNFSGMNVRKVKVDADTSGTTYSILAWS